MQSPESSESRKWRLRNAENRKLCAYICPRAEKALRLLFGFPDDLNLHRVEIDFPPYDTTAPDGAAGARMRWVYWESVPGDVGSARRRRGTCENSELTPELAWEALQTHELIPESWNHTNSNAAPGQPVFALSHDRAIRKAMLPETVAGCVLVAACVDIIIAQQERHTGNRPLWWVVQPRVMQNHAHPGVIREAAAGDARRYDLGRGVTWNAEVGEEKASLIGLYAPWNLTFHG